MTQKPMPQAQSHAHRNPIVVWAHNLRLGRLRDCWLGRCPLCELEVFSSTNLRVWMKGPLWAITINSIAGYAYELDKD